MKESKGSIEHQPHRVFVAIEGDCIVVRDIDGVSRKAIPICKTNSTTLIVENNGKESLIFGILAGISKAAFLGNTNPQVLSAGGTRTLSLNPDVGGLANTSCGATAGGGGGVKSWPVRFDADPSICGDPGDPEMVVEC
jgi:hypothetical protein